VYSEKCVVTSRVVSEIEEYKWHLNNSEPFVRTNQNISIEVVVDERLKLLYG
jgi:hypothetical protein